MLTRIHGYRICCTLIVLLTVAGCSEKKPPSTSEQGGTVTEEESQPAARSAGPQPMVSPDGKDWTLPAESPLTGEFAVLYQQHCVDPVGDEFSCQVLRSLVVAETAMALDEIERSRDQRGTEEALAALDLVGEPLILIAAMRILGPFPETPGMGEKVLPLLLESPWLSVQAMAASLLSNVQDPKVRDAGFLWHSNHEGVAVQSPYEEYPDFPDHYADMGFPEYENAEWFSPLDSDRSIGWSTPDDAEAVAHWFGEALNSEVVDFRTWLARESEQSMAVFQTVDEGKMARMQELTEEWVKTQDIALLEELQKLQEEIYAPAQAIGEAMELGPVKVALPPGSEFYDSARYIVAEERDGRTARLVMVFRLPGLERTAIQHAWSLADYPGAWPQPPSEEHVEEQ